MRGVIRDLSGVRFGRLVAIEPCGRTNARAVIWRCRCDCGNDHQVASQSLVDGKSKSCGCFKALFPAHNRTHNMSGTPLFRMWAAMRNRCQNENVKAYRHYGARGIKVCERWQDFAAFYADMGDRPSPDHSIERIDNDGPYSPENCRWATKKDQASNKRNNRYITANGQARTMADWARELGCTPGAILGRIRAGMSEQEAVTTPIPERPNAKLCSDDALRIRSLSKDVSQAEIARMFGVSKKTIANVLHGRTFVGTASA